MQRSFEPEILDGDGVPPEIVERAHRGLRLTHTLLGNRAAILRALRREGPPVRRVLDVGCGHGGMLADIRARLSIDVIGADLKPPADPPVPIVRRTSHGIRCRRPTSPSASASRTISPTISSSISSGTSAAAAAGSSSSTSFAAGSR